MSEKEYLNENLKQIDDHLILKAYYRFMSNKNFSIDYNLIANMMNIILESQTEGKF